MNVQINNKFKRKKIIHLLRPNLNLKSKHERKNDIQNSFYDTAADADLMKSNIQQHKQKTSVTPNAVTTTPAQRHHRRVAYKQQVL